MKKQDKILVTGRAWVHRPRLLKSLYESGYTNLRSTSWSRELRQDFDGYENVEHINGDLREAIFL